MQGSSPTERAAHATALVGDVLYLFGGRHGAHRLNDLYTLDMARLHWSRSAVAAHALFCTRFLGEV